MLESVRRHRHLAIALLVVLAHGAAFLLCIRHVGFDYATLAENRDCPHSVLYFSTNKLLNECGYVAFYPYVEGVKLANDDVGFAHGGAYLWPAQSMHGATTSYESAELDRWTPGKLSAVIVWHGGILLYILLSLRKLKRDMGGSHNRSQAECDPSP